MAVLGRVRIRRCHLSDDEPFVVAVEDIDIYPAIRASCNRIIPPGTLTG